MVKVITNSNGSGDWIHIKEGDYTIFEGHRIGVNDLVFLLQRYVRWVDLVEVTDEQMEEGSY
jgi:hypothetical protein